MKDLKGGTFFHMRDMFFHSHWGIDIHRAANRSSGSRYNYSVERVFGQVHCW